MRPRNNILVSVCMPAYNASQHVKEAIESVLAQNYGPFELLIADDGSKDNTFQLISQYRHHPKVRIYANEKNRGPAATRNRLVRLSRGKYITPCDADDLMLPGNLKRMSRFLDAHPNIGVVYANWLLLNTTQDNRISRIPEIFGKDHRAVWDLRDNTFNHGGSMIRKVRMLKAGLYDETVRSVDDRSLWLKLTEITQIKYLIHEIYYVCRKRPKSLTRTDKQSYVDTRRIIAEAVSRRSLVLKSPRP